jgi:biopolymer transport protein ExbD
MAMSTGGKRFGPTAEINVTPMADIMIVLLIIFMVAVPIIAKSDVALPLASHARDAGAPPIVVVLKLDRSLGLEGSPARDAGSVASEVRARLEGRAGEGRVVYLKADAGLAYSEVQQVMEMLRELGATDIALMTGIRGAM